MKKEITYEELLAAASYVQARLPYIPKVALVLGSGIDSGRACWMFPAWKSRGLPGADHEGTCALLRRVFDAGGCDASACDAHAWR